MKFYVLLFSTLLSFASFANLHVVIDPGHGGTDSGTTNGQTREADIALLVATEVQKLLAADTNFNVTMTRQGDETVSLGKRMELANQVKGDIFVSIHTNSSPDKRARGFEVYFQNHLPPDEETQFLANLENQIEAGAEGLTAEDNEPSKQNDIRSILDDLQRQFRIRQSLRLSQAFASNWANGDRHNSIRQAPFYVISKANIPSVLIELGYLTNTQDREILTRPEGRQQLAKKIYGALVAYKEKVDKTHVSPLN